MKFLFILFFIILVVCGYGLVTIMQKSITIHNKRIDMISQGICNKNGNKRISDQGAMTCFGYDTNGSCMMNMWIPNMVEEEQYICKTNETFWMEIKYD